MPPPDVWPQIFPKIKGASSALIYNLRQRHPNGHKPMIDYDLVSLSKDWQTQKIIGAKSGAKRAILRFGDIGRSGKLRSLQFLPPAGWWFIFKQYLFWELSKNDDIPRLMFFFDRSNLLWGSYHFQKQSHDGCLQASEDVFLSKPSSELQMKCQLCVALVMLWCMKWHEEFAPCIRWVWQCKADHGAQLAFGCNGRESQRSVCKCWLVFIMLQQSRTWEDSSSLWEHWVQDFNPFCQPFVKLR